MNREYTGAFSSCLRPLARHMKIRGRESRRGPHPATSDPKFVPYLMFTGPAVHEWYNFNRTVYWKVNDHACTSGPNGTGIAGFPQGWDNIPADPATEPNPGAINLFHSGPQSPNAVNGCLSLVNGANGSAGGVSQGCHTLYVQGWNSEGWTTSGIPGHSQVETYWPICSQPHRSSWARSSPGSRCAAS